MELVSYHTEPSLKIFLVSAGQEILCFLWNPKVCNHRPNPNAKFNRNPSNSFGDETVEAVDEIQVGSLGKNSNPLFSFKYLHCIHELADLQIYNYRTLLCILFATLH
jgi:hypothetical protein